jgi:hypothetical protein
MMLEDEGTGGLSSLRSSVAVGVILTRPRSRSSGSAGRGVRVLGCRWQQEASPVRRHRVVRVVSPVATRSLDGGGRELVLVAEGTAFGRTACIGTERGDGACRQAHALFGEGARSIATVAAGDTPSPRIHRRRGHAAQERRERKCTEGHVYAGTQHHESMRVRGRGDGGLRWRHADGATRLTRRAVRADRRASRRRSPRARVPYH